MSHTLDATRRILRGVAAFALPFAALIAADRVGAQTAGTAVQAAAGQATRPVVFLERLSTDALPIAPPTSRVAGAPGSMRIVERSCAARPTAGLRQRIVDIVAQEWAYFGFTVVDQTNEPDTPPVRESRPQRPFRRVWLNPQESERLADSIAGYWAVTPDGPWILERQNDQWNGIEGIASRWRDPWSAAFISWVMCEAGLDDADQFRRAIAHHSYIDQAIVARDSGNREAAYVAHDIGERPIEPGDMLCASRRPFYTTVDERRAQLGVGIRSHCDIVVKVDEPNDRILVIGGNVRGSVSLKLHAADFTHEANGDPGVSRVGRGRRQVFAHLKLRADAVSNDAFERTPTARALAGRRDTVRLVRERLQDQEVFRTAADAQDSAEPAGAGSAL